MGRFAIQHKNAFLCFKVHCFALRVYFQTVLMLGDNTSEK